MRIKATNLDAYNLLHEGVLALADVESAGIHVDTAYCERQNKVLDKKIKKLTKKLDKTPEGKKWAKVYRGKVNYDSPDQLADILFKKMKHKSVNKTKTGKPSTDQNALEKLKIPFVKDYLYIKKLKKTKNTYLNGFIVETINNYMHPFFHLQTARTYRSSSSAPNFQNIPRRDPEIKKIVRKSVIPRKNHLIAELDFSGVEVSVAACYHKDPVMIKDITDPKRDMHRDMAMKCYKLTKKQVTSTLRQVAKGGFVFSQFYGDYYVNNAISMWNSITEEKLVTAQGIPLKKHLKKKGIKNYQQFEDHLKTVENYFWNEKYKVYGQWKRDHYKKYLKTGFVDMYTGFRCTGFMSRNDACNYNIQGSAFHCLLFCLIRLNKWLKKNKMKTKIIGQIHDSLVLDIHVSELNKVLAKTKHIMEVEIMQAWKWLIIPLKADVELTPLNGSWYLKKEVVESACDCGCGWRYEHKLDDCFIYECPVCGEREEV